MHKEVIIPFKSLRTMQDPKHWEIESKAERNTVTIFRNQENKVNNVKDNWRVKRNILCRCMCESAKVK